MENIERYEKMYEAQFNNSEQSICEWINTLLSIRGHRIKKKTKCKDCDIEMSMTSSTEIVCPSCGIINEYHSPDAHMKTTLPYKRMTHFKDWLVKSQAKHSPIIHPDILYKCNYTNHNTIKLYNTVKNVLKKEGLTKHYEDIWYIISYNNPSIEIFKLSNDEENILCNLFLKIQQVWDKTKPKNRKSIISYPFIITKLLDIIKRPELKKFFILPKHNKIVEYEALWRRIINYLSPSSPFLLED